MAQKSPANPEPEPDFPDMFKRVSLEGWHEFVPYLCFALIAGAFLVIVIRAVRMKKSDIEHVANLPLRDDDELTTVDEPASGDDPDPDPSESRNS